MNTAADWSPLFDHLTLAASSRTRIVVSLLFALAAGVASGGYWLGIDPISKLWATMLLMMSPPLILLLCAPRTWSITQRELLGAAISVAAMLGAWSQVARYLASDSPDFWVWPASFLFFVVILGALDTIVSTAFSEAIHDQ